MKHIATTIFIIFLFSQIGKAQDQNDSYILLWQKVQKMEKKGLTKSALDIVEVISKKAKKDQNTQQWVKALLFRSKYMMVLEEDSQLNIIKDFKAEIARSEFPTKNILESYLGNIYWQYFQENRYRFYNRSKTTQKVDPTDFRTWDLTTLFEEINVHFTNSLQNPLRLRNTSLHNFKELLNKQKESETYRPSLLDLLAHTALDFYKTDENSIDRPAYSFELNDPEFLCEAEQFIQLSITSKDTASLQLKALHIYQLLLEHHKGDLSSHALVAVDIERLKYIHQHAIFDAKDAAFLEVLKNSKARYGTQEIATNYTYEIAFFQQQQGNTYHPKDRPEHQWKYRDALALCETVITKYPKSEETKKFRNLKETILSANLRLTMERHIPVNMTGKLLVNYKNHETLDFTAYHISRKEIEELNDLYRKKKQQDFIKKLSVYKQWDVTLKNEGDYQNHSTEIPTPKMESGSYLIFAQQKTDQKQTSFAFGLIQVTNIGLVEYRSNDHYNFQVIDRNNGKPLANANVQLGYRINYQKQQHYKTYTSDKKGLISIPLSNATWTYINATVQYQKEKAYFEEYYINRKNPQTGPETQYTSFTFTDRSIYRPGQSLYFKGIVVEKNETVSHVLKNTRVTVALRDVNGQTVQTQDFTTNDFGSFNGEFIIPNNGLTGSFSLYVTSRAVRLNGYTHISVEEYKRPKFETSFDPIAETFNVNDSVSVKGKAIAYAGSSISGAKVSYTVKRNVYYPRWYYWRHGNSRYNSNNTIIAHGTTSTDASGVYTVPFVALPDSHASKENLPTFSYEVTAEVTDINGETHSATTYIKIGYHLITASITILPVLDKTNKAHKLSISTINLNGQAVPTKGSIKIYKLQAPSRVLRPRPWAAPDYAHFTPEEFKTLFPHEAFTDENISKNWKKGALALEVPFNTGDSKEVLLGDIKKWSSGKYVVELEAKDRLGQPIKDVVEVTLNSPADKKLADRQLFQIKTDKSTYAIGEKVKLSVSSAAKDLMVYIIVEKKGTIVDTYVLSLKNNGKTLTIPVLKEDLGDFSIHYSYAAYNSFHSNSLTVQVPYPDTKLQFETVTFRDKLQPGTEEQWRFNIKGPKGDRVAAEVLASMYDASLDAFQDHFWYFDPKYRRGYYAAGRQNARNSFGITNFNTYNHHNELYSFTAQGYDSFKWFGFYFGNGNRRYRNNLPLAYAQKAIELEGNVESDKGYLDEIVVKKVAGIAGAPNAELKQSLNGDTPGLEIGKDSVSPEKKSFDQVQIRKNLQETAFFFPQLHTDEEGNVSFSFTTPEALTQWKLQLLAHTETLQSATLSLNTVTQKELMVVPNAPRFLREGDQITFSSKIANLTENLLSGEVKLVLVDPISGKPIDMALGNLNPVQKFSVDAKGNTNISWNLQIPESIQAVQYTVIAKAGDFSDGEQNVLPVLSNRTLVTETLPMWVRSDQRKEFSLDKLKNTTSTTLKYHQLTLEITSNPAWYALQALPYLMEYPYDCNEQTFSRYYANSLASHIANSSPRIQQVFKQWANTDALLSNLEKNQELKSLLIQETPWLRDAQSETEQKKRIALLFNINKMKDEQQSAWNKLKNNQSTSGAWPWFQGGRDNRFITQHIITGLGHLKQLQVSLPKNDQQPIIAKAIHYLDNEFVAEYEQMKRYAKDIHKDHLSPTQIHYLYMRSFFEDIPISEKTKKVITYYKEQGAKYWNTKNLYSKGMLALVLHRSDAKASANKIIRSLKENSITSDELGMYWKANTASWNWFQAPIETQAILIEAFSEIQEDTRIVDNLKIWLLKNKQTNQWNTTKATTDAIYALLLQGTEWLAVTDAVEVLVGGKKIPREKLEQIAVEAGTGYYKTSWNAQEIQLQMANVTLQKKGKGIAWGALYWQYFEDLDKITSAKTPLQLKKKLFLKKNTDTGEEITEVSSTTDLKVGDLIRVRIELRADRPMEFVHMKDMRASGLEPITVFSQYKWQDGLGYYESTKDASTNFFFDYLPKGVYVFEYDLRVNNSGNFSNGITTIQSMYAPEFSSHSKGVRVNVGH